MKIHYEMEWKGKTRIACSRPAARTTTVRSEVTCQKCIESMPAQKWASTGRDSR